MHYSWIAGGFGHGFPEGGSDLRQVDEGGAEVSPEVGHGQSGVHEGISAHAGPGADGKGHGRILLRHDVGGAVDDDGIFTVGIESGDPQDPAPVLGDFEHLDIGDHSF